MTSKSTYEENSSEQNHKHAKLNKNIEGSIQSSSLKQIKISSKIFKNNCFIAKNKFLIAGRSCFVPVTRSRDEADIKGNSMEQNLGKQILNSVPKDESKYFLNQWYIA